MSVGLFTGQVLTRRMGRAAEGHGEAAEAVNPSASDEVAGSLGTDPGLRSWGNVTELSTVWFYPEEAGRGHFSAFLFVLPVSPQKMEREPP